MMYYSLIIFFLDIYIYIYIVGAIFASRHEPMKYNIFIILIRNKEEREVIAGHYFG